MTTLKSFSVFRAVCIAVVLLAGLVSCGSRDQRSTDNPRTADLFFDYQVSAEEDDANITCKLQFRMDGPSGDATALPASFRLRLDGEPVPADSAQHEGTFYELQKPAETFSGKHTISYTTDGKKNLDVDFEFTPFRLLTNVPEQVKRADLLLEFEGIGPEDLVRITLADTTFTGNGIHRLDTVKDGKILITKSELAELASGPIRLRIVRESEQPFKNGTPDGGRLFLTYGISREFELND